MKRTLVALLLLFPGIILAQEANVEITPFIGYRWGGEIDSVDSLFDVDLKVESHNSFGLLVDIPLTKHFQLELLADRQSTSMAEEGPLFSPDLNTINVDVDITYYQVGLLWQWDIRRVKAFVATGIGIAEIDPRFSLAKNEEKLSASLATGIKTQLSKHLGLRVEARGFWSDTASGWDWDWDWDWDEDCQPDCWEGGWNGRIDLLQAEISVGLIVSF